MPYCPGRARQPRFLQVESEQQEVAMRTMRARLDVLVRSGWSLEIALVAALYLGGELARGLARGDEATADRHAMAIVHLERRLHVFGGPAIQHATRHLPALPTLLGYAYLTLHLAVTAAVLVWVY